VEFIVERRVELNPSDYDVFLMGLLRRNWKKLVEPLQKFDADVMREFYANAWEKRQEREDRKTMVRGRWIPYSPQVIDDLLVHIPVREMCISETVEQEKRV